MLCRECNKEIGEGSKFCKYCGKNVEKDSETSFCTSCGKQIKSNSLFCKYCGSSIVNDMTVSEKDDKDKKKNFAMKLIVIVLLVLVGLLVFPRNEEKLSKQSDESTYNGDIAQIDKPKSGVTEHKPTKPLSGDDCFICGGDGKKDCTSCDGGYITEYETGTYMGYGSSTREVRKQCKVCRGNGEVKCYH